MRRSTCEKHLETSPAQSYRSKKFSHNKSDVIILVIYEKVKKRKTLRKTRRSKIQRRRPKTKVKEPKANQLKMSKGVRSDSSNNLIRMEAEHSVKRDRPIPQAG